jgi:hypothetical protein
VNVSSASVNAAVDAGAVPTSRNAGQPRPDQLEITGCKTPPATIRPHPINRVGALLKGRNSNVPKKASIKKKVPCSMKAKAKR